MLLLVLLVVGSLLWLAERRANPEQFPRRAVPGIGNGIWLALVTMTTVGYGDRVPITKAGRVIAGVWMVVALISASSLTAGIATGLTISQLRDPTIARLGDLEGQPVAVVQGTTGAELAKVHGARLIESSTLQQAIERVGSGQARAVVFDRPMLAYHLKQNPTLPLELSQGAWEPQGYGFAMRLDDELLYQVNVALLELSESGRIRRIIQDWLGAAQGD